MKPNGIIEFILSGTSYHNSYGKLTIEPDQLAQGVAEFNALPENERRLPVKYGKHDQGTDAAGWIIGLVGVPQAKPERVLATVEWTEQGAQAIKDKRQRYISPEFAFNWVNNKTGKKGFAFLGAALLNDPHMTALAPAIAFAADAPVTIGPSIPLDRATDSRVALASDGVIPMDVREKMCTMLGLDASASDDDMIAKIAELQKAKADGETEIEVKLSAAMAPKDAEIVSLTAAVAEKEKTLSELQIQLAAANTAAQAAASEKLDLEAKQAVEALIAQGKALPRERAVLLSAYKKDPADAKAQWEVRGKVIELSTVTGINDPAGLGGIELATATQKKLEAEGKSPFEAAVEAMKLTQG